MTWYYTVENLIRTDDVLDDGLALVSILIKYTLKQRKRVRAHERQTEERLKGSQGENYI